MPGRPWTAASSTAEFDLCSSECIGSAHFVSGLWSLGGVLEMAFNQELQKDHFDIDLRTFESARPQPERLMCQKVPPLATRCVSMSAESPCT
jgi:hypothetical protein